MRTITILALLLVGFAGCADDAADEPATVDEPTELETSDDAGGNTTQTPDGDGSEPATNATQGDALNTPPSALLTADIEQGTVPFDVLFALSGEDADGDALTWTLDVDGDGAADHNGSELPANVTATYTDAGTYNVTFWVTDGMNTTTANVTINGTAAMAATGPVQVASGTVVTSPYGCLQNGYLNGPATPYFLTFGVDPASYGLPFRATFTTTVPSIENAVHFWIGSSTVAGVYSSDATTVEGTVPESDTAYLAPCGGLNVEVTYQAGGL